MKKLVALSISVITVAMLLSGCGDTKKPEQAKPVPVKPPVAAVKEVKPAFTKLMGSSDKPLAFLKTPESFVDSNTIKVLPPKTPVEILGFTSNSCGRFSLWSKVKLQDGSIGYINNETFKAEKSIEACWKQILGKDKYLSLGKDMDKPHKLDLNNWRPRMDAYHYGKNYATCSKGYVNKSDKNSRILLHNVYDTNGDLRGAIKVALQAAKEPQFNYFWCENGELKPIAEAVFKQKLGDDLCGMLSSQHL